MTEFVAVALREFVVDTLAPAEPFEVQQTFLIGAGAGGGGGAVASVNGHTGVVVLTATDVGADASGAADAKVSDAVYGVGWDGDTSHAPSKNAVYDKIQTLGAGATNLSYTPSPTDGTVVSDTGADATVPLATGTNAGLLKPADFTKLSNTSGTNTGDQTLVGLGGVPTTRQVNGHALSADVTVTKGDIALGNVDNVSDVNKPVSTAQAAADALKANIASPTFTGTVTVPSGAVLATPASVTLTNGTGLPESGVTNLTTDLAAKAPLASPTFTGTVTVPSGAVLGTPTSVNLSNATALPDTALSNHGTAGTYGDGTHIPVITTDARGFVTAVSTATPTVADPPTVAIIARANYK